MPESYVPPSHTLPASSLSEARLRAMLETVPHVAVQWYDHLGRVIYWNPASEQLYGWSAGEAIGRTLDELMLSPDQAENFRCLLGGLAVTGGRIGPEIYPTHNRDGESRFVEATIFPIPGDEPGQPIFVCMDIDVTARYVQQQQLENMAHYDALTGLPNRVLLADRLRQAMAQVHRRGHPLGVVYIDLDGFKAINDRHGHVVGDQLLVALAQRMANTLREGDTVARLGGDEFVAILLDISDRQASRAMLDRLQVAVADTVTIGRLQLQVSASIGVTFYPQAEDADADQLLRQADQAMYQAKLAGKNRYHLFDLEHDRDQRGRHESIENVRGGLQRREFVLHYQPKVNLRSGAVIGVEALVRWQHPVRGLLPPAEFLPVLEGHSLAIDLGEYVLEEALRQIERWNAGGLRLPVSVNIDALHLLQKDFFARLRDQMAHHPGVGPGDLEIEILETSALDDILHVSAVMAACREIGVDFALDDFGTGYSSLTYLRRLPVKVLKIDQSFVRNMLDDPDDLAIMEGVLGLARVFRREAIAEGMETPAHGCRLLQIGCELAQGYAIARPMPAAALPAWLAGWRPDPAWQL